MRPVTLGQVSLLGTTMGSPRDFGPAAVEHVSWTPVIDSVRPLAEADAHAREEAGDHFGSSSSRSRRPPGPVAALVLAAARREPAGRPAAATPPSRSTRSPQRWRPIPRPARRWRRPRPPAVRPSSSRWGPAGARALRERRAAEAHRAVGDLLLAGELVADGAGR